jgi:hypothetical protein
VSIFYPCCLNGNKNNHAAMLHARAECNELTTSTRRHGKGAVPFIYPCTTSYCSRIIGENDIDFLLCNQHFINPHTLNSLFRSHYSQIFIRIRIYQHDDFRRIPKDLQQKTGCR